MSDKTKDENEIIVELCPKLFSWKKSFSFECGHGWTTVLGDLCLQLEDLNEKYRKHHIRIFAEQIKEKFGTLRFYYEVAVEDKSFFRRSLIRFSRWMVDIFRSIDYKYVKVVDVPEFKKEEIKELSEKEYKDLKKVYGKNSSYKFFKKDGKFYRSCMVLHCAQVHYEPTKHKISYRIFKTLGKIHSWMVGFEKYTPEQEAIREIVTYKVDKLIASAEKECMNYCELCGCHISDSGFNSRCETLWWIRYVCEDCAVKMDTSYYKNGALYNNRKCVMSKKKLESKLKNK